jgi:hypothetical protein
VKKIILLLAFFLLSASARAENTFNPAHPFYIGLGTGLDFPISGWNPNYYVAGGTHFFGGYRFNFNWSAELDVADWVFIGGDTALYNFRFLAQAKYTFDVDGWQPYLLAGPGLSLQTHYFDGGSASDPDFLAGAGAQLELGGHCRLFLQGELNLIPASGSTALDVPLTAGLWVVL